MRICIDEQNEVAPTLHDCFGITLAFVFFQLVSLELLLHTEHTCHQFNCWLSHSDRMGKVTQRELENDLWQVKEGHVVFSVNTSHVTLTSVSMKHQLQKPYSTNEDTHLGKNTDIL